LGLLAFEVVATTFGRNTDFLIKDLCPPRSTSS
jgi:hypothetical protein